jgi:hypothetical protein
MLAITLVAPFIAPATAVFATIACVCVCTPLSWALLDCSFVTWPRNRISCRAKTLVAACRVRTGLNCLIGLWVELSFECRIKPTQIRFSPQLGLVVCSFVTGYGSDAGAAPTSWWPPARLRRGFRNRVKTAQFHFTMQLGYTRLQRCDLPMQADILGQKEAQVRSSCNRATFTFSLELQQRSSCSDNISSTANQMF